MQTDKPRIVRLLYVSTLDTSLTLDDVRRIVDRAQVRNRQHDVTGMLVYHPPHFVQVLEGRPDALDALMVHISCDPRHRDVQLIERVETDRRRFDRWGMALACTGALAADLDGLGQNETDPCRLLAAMEREAQLI